MSKEGRIISFDSSCTPDFLILGVQKSATTALFDTLKTLDGFMPAKKKEIHFFDSDLNYGKGFDWYASHFQQNKTGLSFEATPSYIYSIDAAARIGRSMAGKKFVVMLRDPVKRCVSAWNMFRNFNLSPITAKYIQKEFIDQCNIQSAINLKNLLFSKNFPTFEQCIEDDLLRYAVNDAIDEPSFVRRGFYYDQINRYLDYFNLADFIFIEQSEYESNPMKIVNEICEFFDLDLKLCGDMVTANSNIGDYANFSVHEHVPALLKLYEVYRGHNEKLFELLGREFPWGQAWLKG